MSLCFLKLWLSWKDGELPEQEFLSHLLAHYRGVRHKDDEIPSTGEPLANFEPWLASVRDLALAGDYESVEDTSEHERLFSLCLQGRTEEFKAALQTARARALQPYPLQPCACIAAQRQNLVMFNFCLDQGAKFDRYLTRAAQKGARGNTDFLECLLKRNWANIQRSPEAVLEQVSHYGEDSMEAEWLRKHAGDGLEVDREGGKTKTKLKDTPWPKAPKGAKSLPTDEQLDWIDQHVNW